jgi:UDP-N-acetylglucosamine 4,6-dehydratase/5-epimerase
MTDHSALEGRSFLITGGTGSFGQQAVATLVKRFAPRRVVVYSRDEFKQYEMAAEHDHPCIRYFIGDVRDRRRLSIAMKDIDYVIHAAALKHVGIAEYNPMECVKTNIHGTENVIHAALENGVQKVVTLSTDKAVNPINLYGATKLAADKLTVAANNFAGGHPTRFSVARYGNVVGSRGSVLPFFAKLIGQGAGRLPITDVRMTRFWITIEEGVDFVLKSFIRMHGGEIFVPKLPSFRIVDLATAMAPTIPQEIIGIRPGEKVHEIMCPADESRLTLDFADHYLLRPSITFNAHPNDFLKNAMAESGQPVAEGFEYHSGRNERFLTVEQIRGSEQLRTAK